MNLRAAYQRARGYVGMKVNGVSFLIDIIDACSSRCPSCPVGIYPSKGGHKMMMDVFRKVLDKAESECKIRKVQLYRWCDPLLHPLVHEFVEECVRRGIRASVSSDLQATTCDFPKLMLSGLAEFRVSFSGWRGMHYYQRPATPEKFFKKFDYINSLPCHSSTKKVMFFHIYKDNEDEVHRARVIAGANRYEFVAFPATYMMYDRIVNQSYLPEDEEILRRLLETPEENIARFKHRPRHDDYCELQEKEVVLDSYGRMKQCQLMGFWDEYNRGDFLTIPMKDIRKKIMTDPMCPRCKATGVPTYSLIFADPAVAEDPISSADDDKYV